MKAPNKKIEDTLNAFDHITRASAPEDFEKTLFARLQFVPVWVKWFQYSAAVLVIFGIINLLTVFSLSTEKFISEETEYMEDNLLTDTSYPILIISLE